MNKLRLSLLVFGSCLLLASSGLANTILIDPGHGGEDHGASAILSKKMKNGEIIKSKILEKDLALQLSKRIYERLKKKRYDVYLTRSIDRTVSLEERAEMADKIKANLFISIHFNSSLRKGSRGFETYYLDNHKDVAVKKVENVENNGLKGEDLIVQHILTDLVIERTVSISKKLAENIHDSIDLSVSKKYQTPDRKFKPGLFYVLALSKRPGVLLEVGFLSNSKELKTMSRTDFQESYSRAVVEGIEKFFKGNKSNTAALF